MLKYLLFISILVMIIAIVLGELSKRFNYDIKELISRKLDIDYETISQFDIEEANDKVYIRANYYWIVDEHWKYTDENGNRLGSEYVSNNPMIEKTIYLLLDLDNKTFKIYTTNIQLMMQFIGILNIKGYSIHERIIK